LSTNFRRQRERNKPNYRDSFSLKTELTWRSFNNKKTNRDKSEEHFSSRTETFDMTSHLEDNFTGNSLSEMNMHALKMSISAIYI
jgi:hypothetical protein